MEEKNKFVWKKYLAAAGGILLLALIIRAQIITYDKTDLIFAEMGGDLKNCIYSPLGKGMLCVSRGSISLVDDNGKEKWKYSVEFASPVIETAGDKAVCYDKGGNKIIVVDEKGYRTEAEMSYPIEKATISGGGCFAAILDNGRAPQVVCYDQEGKEKAKHQTSLKNRGYPIALALDADGDRLAVSYLDVRYGMASGLVTCFELKKDGREETLELPDNIVPEVSFYNKDDLVLVGSAGIKFASVKNGIKIKKAEKTEGKIEKVVMGEDNICIVSRKYGRESIVSVFNPEGEKEFSATFDKMFDHVELGKKEVFCYTGKQLQILTFSGREKFRGSVPKRIESVKSAGGSRKYMIAGDDGICGVRINK